MRQKTYTALGGASQTQVVPATTQAREEISWWMHLLWLGLFGLVGFAISAVFSGLLELRRDLFVLAYLVVAAPLIGAYIRVADIELRAAFVRRWKWGLFGALVAGAFVVANVLGQEASTRPEGMSFMSDLAWFGLVYGLLDAVFLSIMPVAMAWLAVKDLALTGRWYGKVAVGILALLASLFVTVMYHWGFTEYQGADIGGPVIGNGVLSLAYIVTGNPLASALSHIAMHVTSVLHGIESTIQLPPHY